MIMKTCGAVLVILGALGLLFYLLTIQKLHARGLMDMKNVLNRMDQQVNYLGIPLPDIVSEEARRLSGELGDFFQSLCKKLDTGENATVEEMVTQVWLEMIEKGSIFTALERETFQEALLISFGQKYTGNPKALESYLTAVDDLIMENRKERERERKLTVTMTMMGTAAILCLLM